MTHSEMYTMLTSMTDESDQAVLDSYISMAESIALDYLYPYDHSVTEIPDRYRGVVVRIAAYHLNKKGAEGQLMHIENGTHRSYEAGDTPVSLLRELTPTVGVIK